MDRSASLSFSESCVEVANGLFSFTLSLKFRQRSGSKVRSSFRQHGRFFELHNRRPLMTLCYTRTDREGNFARAAATVRR